ncbi:MAG TPA: energy transducer TonB [Ferruginibacter sp.]|nr:energy transducer TonB [Ferruginibacter sp.]
MTPDRILQADLLDIVFEKRNKHYGAYVIRKYYPNRVYKALGLVFLFAALLCSLSLLKKDKKLTSFLFDAKDPELAQIAKSPIEKTVIIPKPKTQATIKARTDLFVSNMVITRNPADASRLSKNLDSALIGSVHIPGTDPGAIPLARIAPGPITTTIPGTEIPKNINRDHPLTSAEVMPEFPGGIDALRKFMERNLRNPRDLESGEDITVKIRFIVGYDGNLKGFETVEDGGTEFNEEVIRVLKKMPAWHAGKTKGEDVSVYFTIPVKFQSSED